MIILKSHLNGKALLIYTKFKDRAITYSDSYDFMPSKDYREKNAL